MVDIWKPDLSRDVYQRSVTAPEPYPSRHACKRWEERSDTTRLTVLDAWNISPGVEIAYDHEVESARLFSPSSLVLMGVRDDEGKQVIKTVKYLNWLRDSGKVVKTERLTKCDDCGLFEEHGEACRWCRMKAVERTG